MQRVTQKQRVAWHSVEWGVVHSQASARYDSSLGEYFMRRSERDEENVIRCNTLRGRGCPLLSRDMSTERL